MSVSENGTLLFGSRTENTTQLAWFDRSGTLLANVPGATGYLRAALSPDEKTIAADRLDPETQSQDVWLIEARRGVTSRVTTNPGHDQMARWSPDGRQILYGSTREGEPSGTRMKALDAGADERLFSAPDSAVHQITDWSSDGRYIVYGRLDGRTKWDLWVVPAAVDPTTGVRTPVAYLQTEFNEHHGRLSPDGRWMAYASDESGRSEVYVDAFPKRGARRQISSDGGYEPQWRGDGKELFYQTPNRVLMVAGVITGSRFSAVPPRPLFKMPIAETGTALPGEEPRYAVSRAGDRFLINTVVAEQSPPAVGVILGWPALLNAR
jgi:Tol biopolymer transport system component